MRTRHALLGSAALGLALTLAAPASTRDSLVPLPSTENGPGPGGLQEQRAPSAPLGGPLTGRTVVLDPGHNAGNLEHLDEIDQQVDIGNGRKECDTTGTMTATGYPEAAFSLDVAHRAREILQNRGANVVLTHDGERPWGPCITERAAIGNAAHADAALSIHADGAPATNSGFYVILPGEVVAGPADTTSILAPSRRLGEQLRDHFHAATAEPYADYYAEQGLVTASDLGGLNLSTVPKVFIECANMPNPEDARKLTDPQWRQLAAQGIADAFTSYLEPD
ncbi:N-acetylmuramoyl-L-alanine amidase [Kitasatospora sp. GAS204B]|uniref:N-acetylmuramoyl-L-alanine amidase n=1 Tax=unclassified Kitasatospora TaxID=2633591 RepID=UPI002475905D|nr:N-acetylmuramoyl-L-alanine amidase [Kitasatospora sp. GAS204B]MDH6119729.1 N-acetylmuramoyl-L-alanine amidase [Kitasatospora sp. GAS204B]